MTINIDRLFKSEDDKNYCIENWKRFHRNGYAKPYGKQIISWMGEKQSTLKITAVAPHHHLLYNLIRGLPHDRGFTPRSDKKRGGAHPLAKLRNAYTELAFIAEAFEKRDRYGLSVDRCEQRKMNLIAVFGPTFDINEFAAMADEFKQEAHKYW